MKMVYICNVSGQQQDDILPLPATFPDRFTLNQNRTQRLTPSANAEHGENRPDDDVLPLPSMVFDPK